jgi:hypothetical protein
LVVFGLDPVLLEGGLELRFCGLEEGADLTELLVEPRADRAASPRPMRVVLEGDEPLVVRERLAEEPRFPVGAAPRRTADVAGLLTEEDPLDREVFPETVFLPV